MHLETWQSHLKPACRSVDTVLGLPKLLKLATRRQRRSQDFLTNTNTLQPHRISRSCLYFLISALFSCSRNPTGLTHFLCCSSTAGFSGRKPQTVTSLFVEGFEIWDYNEMFSCAQLAILARLEALKERSSTEQVLLCRTINIKSNFFWTYF